VDELRGLGSITERVVAAVVPLDVDPSTRGRIAMEYEAKEAGKVEIKELEERVKKELRAVMLLGEHEDVSFLEPRAVLTDSLTQRIRTTTRSPLPCVPASASLSLKPR
jgi:transcriptional adapter 3